MFTITSMYLEFCLAVTLTIFTLKIALYRNDHNTTVFLNKLLMQNKGVHLLVCVSVLLLYCYPIQAPAWYGVCTLWLINLYSYFKIMYKLEGKV